MMNRRDTEDTARPAAEAKIRLTTNNPNDSNTIFIGALFGTNSEGIS
jgi:hypothetical protein